MDSTPDIQIGQSKSESFIKSGSLTSDEPKAPAKDGPRSEDSSVSFGDNSVGQDSNSLQGISGATGLTKPQNNVLNVKAALLELGTVEGSCTWGVLAKNEAAGATGDSPMPGPTPAQESLDGQKISKKEMAEIPTETTGTNTVSVEGAQGSDIMFESDWETDYDMSDPRTPYGDEEETISDLDLELFSFSYSDPSPVEIKDQTKANHYITGHGREENQSNEQPHTQTQPRKYGRVRRFLRRVSRMLFPCCFKRVDEEQ